MIRRALGGVSAAARRSPVVGGFTRTAGGSIAARRIGIIVVIIVIVGAATRVRRAVLFRLLHPVPRRRRHVLLDVLLWLDVVVNIRPKNLRCV